VRHNRGMEERERGPAADRFQFWIDRGGTFTDVVAQRSDGTLSSAKLLSEDPEHYQDAAVAGMRKLLGLAPDEALPIERIECVKMGTTVATNALLERKGEPTVLFITRGFRDQLRIGYQNRPRLFERQIRLPELLYGAVYEANERVDAAGRVLIALDEEALKEGLAAAYGRGFRSVAIVFMHGYRFPRHEQRAAELACAAGFSQISTSHATSPSIKLVARGDTTVVDAYLSPILRRYVTQVGGELSRDGQTAPLYFMKSDGGLSDPARFFGKDAILSGPAGGIVGMVKSSLAAGFYKVIGFDMGGTSTDVSHFAGDSLADCERELDTEVAGVRLRAPMMAIHTIAAGGGSILHFDGQRFRVGPDSAGANPGPLSYQRGGPLTVTDCNVMLGRLQPEFFPRLFGEDRSQPLDHSSVVSAFQNLAGEVARATARVVRPEHVAEGFLQVAVANMANAIKFISVQRGHDVTEYTLCCFGGAAGQHACAVADELGVSSIFVHPLSGVLSAFGMGLAELSTMRESPLEKPLNGATLGEMAQSFEVLAESARAGLKSQGVNERDISILRRARLKYDGTDTALSIEAGDEAAMRTAFAAAYRRRFSFLMPDRAIVVEALSVEARGTACQREGQTPASHVSSWRAPELPQPCAQVRMFSEGQFRDVPAHRRESLASGQQVAGPALIIEANATIVVEAGWLVEVGHGNQLVLRRHVPRPTRHALGTAADPVMLEVFNNLFMSIAEQMGVRLSNTAYSVNIKERLDFSCALFDDAGNLIANAPHMPVHLGSMGESIKTVMRRNHGRMRPGDVYMLNDPYNGGTHLPDVTVVMPVFREGDAEILFYVAARGHHADIGGITPGSMPPGSRNVEEEGVLIDNFKLVEARGAVREQDQEQGRMREAELITLLTSARYPARNPAQNVADLRAQVAACEKGREELLKMVSHFGLATVRAYMNHVQDNAEESVRRAIALLKTGHFEHTMDNGAKIVVRVEIDRDARAATIDFTGTSAQLEDNFNAPPAVTHAAVLYVFRTLVSDDIPMNAGCLRPLSVVIPEGSMLAPRHPAATVAGNVETSQCIVDAIYGALSLMGAAQGTMNNFTFGNARHQYYETIAGGSGAGAGFDGTAAVQTHMTNSRITDPEVLELRFPVLVEEHSIREGSGGRGRYRGGDGALRRIRFLEPMTAAILAGHRKEPPYGAEGGFPGEVGGAWVERARDQSRELLTYADQRELEAGDVFVVSTPSGGGYGPPS
jgi:5-oxoprolinase (ATP-hydrolysing)